MGGHGQALRGESRSVALPTYVQVEHAEASFEHGVLKITLPRAEEERPRHIEVESG